MNGAAFDVVRNAARVEKLVSRLTSYTAIKLQAPHAPPAESDSLLMFTGSRHRALSEASRSVDVYRVSQLQTGHEALISSLPVAP